MGVKVKINYNNLARHVRDHPQKVDAGLRALAQEGENHAKMLIQQSPADGRTYGSHVASSPGNAPRSLTGTLINTIHWMKLGELSYQLRDGVKYGIELEFGTRSTAPRPFFTPTAKHLEEIVEDVFDDFLTD